MRTCIFLARCCLLSSVLISHNFILRAAAYKPLADSFLRNISSGGSDFDPGNGALLSPILTPRVPGTAGHSAVQHHFVDFFTTQLPRWTLNWVNSTATTPTGAEVNIQNLVFQREPPWTKQGQANWLTLAAHYDSKNIPDRFIGATDSAVPCAILMHVARSIDPYVTQMHDEMAELGEGGTVEMDMGVQIMLIDGKEGFESNEAGLFGSRAMAEIWENTTNPAGSKYHNALSQISILVLLDVLGSVNPTIPSYFLNTHWVLQNIANLEERMRDLDLLESKPLSAFIPKANETTTQPDTTDDYIPFINRGIPSLHILPSPLPANRHTIDDNGENLDLPTVRDWAKLVTGFALEWLDMMEVWPE